MTIANALNKFSMINRLNGVKSNLSEHFSRGSWPSTSTPKYRAPYAGTPRRPYARTAKNNLRRNARQHKTSMNIFASAAGVLDGLRLDGSLPFLSHVKRREAKATVDKINGEILRRLALPWRHLSAALGYAVGEIQRVHANTETKKEIARSSAAGNGRARISEVLRARSVDEGNARRASAPPERATSKMKP